MTNRNDWTVFFINYFVKNQKKNCERKFFLFVHLNSFLKKQKEKKTVGTLNDYVFAYYIA